MPLQAAADQPCHCPCKASVISLDHPCPVPTGASSLTTLLPLQASFILTHRLGREFNFIHYVRESMDDDFSKWVCLLLVFRRGTCYGMSLNSVQNQHTAACNVCMHAAMPNIEGLSTL